MLCGHLISLNFTLLVKTGRIFSGLDPHKVKLFCRGVNSNRRIHSKGYLCMDLNQTVRTHFLDHEGLEVGRARVEQLGMVVNPSWIWQNLSLCSPHPIIGVRERLGEGMGFLLTPIHSFRNLWPIGNLVDSCCLPQVHKHPWVVSAYGK